MTELLTKAFEQASELPQKLQDELARQILEALAAPIQGAAPSTLPARDRQGRC